jgi:hypothetical protein
LIHRCIVFAAVAVAFCAMTGLGIVPARFLERAYRPSRLLRLPLLAMSGWGIAALLSAAVGVAGFNQTWLARVLLVVGLILLIPRRGPAWAASIGLLGDLGLLLLFVAPMGLLVAGSPAAAYDEFAQWLPNTRYLVEHAHYWMWPDWLGQTSKPGYPNGSLIVALLAGQLSGPEVETPFKTFVVILLGGFGAALADLAAARFVAEEGGPWPRRRTEAALLALGCLVAFVDPFNDPRISFTSYTDAPSGIVLAIAALAACRGIDAARRNALAVADGWFGWVGLLSLTLVLLRQTNLVFVGALDAAAAVILLALRGRRPLPWKRRVFPAVVPAAAGVLVWMAHLWLEHIGPDITPRPWTEWDWSAPVSVAKAFFFDRLADNPVLGVAALGILALAVIGVVAVWRRLGAMPEDDLPSPRSMVLLAAMISVSFVVFLAWTYVAVFSAAEVAAAASLWRYLSELGPLALLTGWCVLLAFVPNRPLNPRLALAAWAVAACGLLALPVVGRAYYRLDCRFPDIAASRDAVAELRPALERFNPPPGQPARVAVVNPTVGDWMAHALAYDMRWPASRDLIRFRVENEPLAETEAWAWDQKLDALLDLRPLDRSVLRGGVPPSAVTLLSRPGAKGEPWPVLATAAPRSPPSCSIWP